MDIATRHLKARDGRLLARELASAVIEEIASNLSAEREATPLDIAAVNRSLAIVRGDDTGDAAGGATLLPLILERVGTGFADNPADLSDHGLLTGREGTDNLLTQLKRELASCNRIDWLVSFIKLSAVNMLKEAIESFLERGGTMRVITTAYMGATDPAALEQLAKISMAHHSRLQIRFSRETDATRLHAKAYIHHRGSGFGTAYIGSANLSRPALTEGLEWTVRLSQVASPSLWSKIEETFAQWWSDEEFVEYGLEVDHPTHAQFRDLVAREKGSTSGSADSQPSALPIFDLQPKPFQQAILDRIATERDELMRTRHLIVAATGTGKTMIAAFDYRNFAATFVAAERRPPRLLYVAHSQRILMQARGMFQQVVRDLNFGGLLVGGQDDRPCTALFASIQSWTATRRRAQSERALLPPDHFDYVVVDEVHHGEANTWRALLDWIKPRSLLGLTATPERADGLDITRHFEGRTTAELRLPDAIARRLLVPFRYFGVTDDIDLRHVAWTPRGYKMDEVQSRYLDAGPLWIELVRRAIFNYVADPLRMRAIGFCSGVDHARAMAKEFEGVRAREEARGQHALRAEALSGDDTQERRDDVIGRLKRGETQVVFVADLFNEGVDIPEVDTVLFMRPTDSLTVYVQQLGRGLRLCPNTDKDCLTALDFVGQYRKEFRFAQRLGAMLADESVSVQGQVEYGFTALPPGCSITLERIARERVLANIHAQTRTRRARLIETVQLLRERLERWPTMHESLEATREDPRVFYKTSDARLSWSGVLHGAMRGGDFGVGEVGDPAGLAAIKPFVAPLRAIASITDRTMAKFALCVLDALEALAPTANLAQSLAEDRRLQVLLIEFGAAVKTKHRFERAPTSRDVIKELRANEPLRRELRALLEALATRVGGPAPTPNTPLPDGVPLALHRDYTQKQIFAAFGWKSAWHTNLQAGRLWLEDHSSYIMLVTLEKDPESFTERTRYRDYAISPSIFHWQSQSTAMPGRGDGLRIARAKDGTGTMWLFVRRAQKDNYGTEPFAFMGAFRPTSITGKKPMSVEGDLANAMPPTWAEIALRAR